MSDAIRTSCVQFSKDVASTGEDDIEDLELQSFVRHNTPHPKDLKARHPKMFPTPDPAGTTGPVPVHPVTTRLTPDVATGDTPTCGIAQRAQAAPVSPPTLPANSANPVHSYPSPAYANVVAKPVSGAVSGADAPPTSYAHERHVGFSDDEDADADVEPEEPDVDVGEDVGEDGEEESVKRDETETKLRRRDTPHHLKNKRVTGAGVATTTTTTAASTAAGDSSAATAGLTATSISDRQRVADILAKNAAAASASASRTLASPSSPPDHDYENGEDLYRQHTIVITRNVGQGLGISIAGGKGSAAYIGDDEVLSRPKCEYFSVGSTIALGVLWRWEYFSVGSTLALGVL